MKIMRRAALLLFCTCLLFSGQAQISTADRDSLTRHLNVLSQGWVDPSVQKCNQIFGKATYNWQDWKGFFDEYYAHYPLTSTLKDYLVYPTFFWLGPDANFKLQQGQKWAFLQQLDSLFALTDLGQLLDSKPLFRQELSNFVQFLDDLTFPDYTRLPDSSLNHIDSELAAMIEKRPLLKRTVTINPSTQPFVAVYALKLHSILLRLKPLTPARVEFICTKLGLPLPYRNLLASHGLFLGDNNSMKAADIAYIDRLLKATPKSIHRLKILTHNDYLYASGQTHLASQFHLPAVNVFSSVGGYQENGFPSDVPPFPVDGFAIVVGHELNHRVDPDYVYLDSGYSRRRRQLISQAGQTDLNYLRSWSGSGSFFQSAPQEFFASISNQYLANTELTLSLGIKRFENGYKEPINQFLYFAEIYSCRGDTTLFYQNNIQADIQAYKVPVKRDSNGWIREFTLNGKTYSFSFDASGNVTAIHVQNLTTALPPVNALDATVRVSPNPAQGLIILRSEKYSIQQVTLLDGSGKRIPLLQGGGSKTLRLDLAAYRKGLYFLEIRIKNQKSSVIKKVLIQ